MSKRYPGNFITGNPVALSQSSNSGIYDLKDQYQATTNGTWQEADGVYEIGKSVRLRSSASAYFNRTPASAGNRKTWTWSGWVKRGVIGVNHDIFTATRAPSTRPNFDIGFNASNNDKIAFNQYNGSGYDVLAYSSRVFRDPSAWYHLCVVLETANATTNDRLRLYVNGERDTISFTNSITQNADLEINNNVLHKIGSFSYVNGNYFDGYLTEINFIDGQALDPSYFGYTDSITGIWQPKKYSGSYGNNGFYLPFNEPVATSGTVNSLPLGRNFAGSNYIRSSENGSATGYTVDRATNNINIATAPDGTLTGNKLTSDTTASNTHRFYCGTASATPAGTTQTTSIYLKYATCRYVNIENWNGTSYQTQTFDILNGVPAASGVGVAALGFTYQHVGNGWYRVSVPLYHGSGAVGNSSVAVYLCDASGNNSWTGDGTSAVYWWGAQLNLGTTPDAYIKTTGTASINDWTPNNISVAAGATYDVMVDSPTNVFTSATDIGGVVPGNYCTLNPVGRTQGGNSNYGSFSNANLSCTTTGNPSHAWGTMAIPADSNVGFYWEAVCTSMDTVRTYIGIIDPHTSPSVSNDGSSYSWPYKALLANPGHYLNFASGTGGGNQGTYTSYAQGDTVMIAYKNGSIWFGKNGVWMNSGNPAAGTGALDTGIDTSKTWLPYVGYNSNFTVNFGQLLFAHTPPAGFKSLNTTNLQALGTTTVGKAAVQANKWFDISLYGGTGAQQNVVNSGGFQPDLVWYKSRNITENHQLFDSVRGVQRSLYSNLTNTETTDPGVYAFNSDGFNSYNTNGYTYVAWQWKQSPTSGFNIVTYTGDNSANRAISHNLGVTPTFAIIKSRTNAAGTPSWHIYHKSVSPTNRMFFESTSSSIAASGMWGSSAWSSSNFYVGWDGANYGTNYTGSTYVAYIFAEVPGFSKFGSYTGTSLADGPFVYLGFKPKWITIRSTSANREWNCWDTARGPYNINNGSQLDLGNAHSEYAYSGYNDVVDVLSNGFKLRSAGSPNYNAYETYVWAAFAESPFALNNRAR